jgi:sterol desaturase/sphingolipid hydroxylase (fatty acid hydroxylase superfamily)
MDARTLKKLEQTRKIRSIVFVISGIISLMILVAGWFVATHKGPLWLSFILYYTGTVMVFLSVIIFGAFAFYSDWRYRDANKQ